MHSGTALSAHCRTDPDAMYVRGIAQDDAAKVCTGCPIRTECLADALDNRIQAGVWGGMTARKRRALLARRPEVTDWAALLERARRHYEQTAPTPAPAPVGRAA
ncbi:WhiB family transcriptional regulator [Nocardiopsis sp. NPDC006139]|uniref:WhiB family transcriptional regulator n=1 Tax=Nocardiopsis sp. NPDC006139 TaxID=3154578 RepID=UPI0033ACEB47